MDMAWHWESDQKMGEVALYLLLNKSYCFARVNILYVLV
jgi:hypothetical protein